MARAINTVTDHLDFFAESLDSTSAILTVTATGTGTNSSANQINTVHHGAVLYFHLTSISVNTATLGVNFNGIDAVSGSLFPIGRASFDAFTAAGNFTVLIYPGVTTAAGAGLATNVDAINSGLPQNWQVTTSLTISGTTASMSGFISYSVGMSKMI